MRLKKKNSSLSSFLFTLLLFGLLSTFETVQVEEEERDEKRTGEGLFLPSELSQMLNIHTYPLAQAVSVFFIMTIHFLPLKKKFRRPTYILFQREGEVLDYVTYIELALNILVTTATRIQTCIPRNSFTQIIYFRRNNVKLNQETSSGKTTGNSQTRPISRIA